MRGEGDDHVAVGGARKFLVELRHVAMVADAVGVKALGHFRDCLLYTSILERNHFLLKQLAL